jgi:hypothetical protein
MEILSMVSTGILGDMGTKSSSLNKGCFIEPFIIAASIIHVQLILRPNHPKICFFVTISLYYDQISSRSV